jgi:hypothetical protein
MMPGALKGHRPIIRSSRARWFTSVTLLVEIEWSDAAAVLHRQGLLLHRCRPWFLCLGGYHEKAPIAFAGKIKYVHVQYIK